MQEPPPASQELMNEALDLARGAGELTLSWFRSATLEIETKGDGSPVTEADKAAERYIREGIEIYAPGSSLVGEEEGSSKGSGPLTWYIDPIDGTKAFARGVPLYSTLIAVNDEHGPAVGIIHIPATGETVWAGRGLGAFCNDGAAKVSAKSELKGAYVTTSSVSRWSDEQFASVCAAGMDVRGWGDGYGWLMVATGRVEAMIDLGTGRGGRAGKPWDYAPLPVIMAEAGGRFSCLNGTIDIFSPSVVASNGLIHEDLLSLVKP